jgi:hypothetical protein
MDVVDLAYILHAKGDQGPQWTARWDVEWMARSDYAEDMGWSISPDARDISLDLANVFFDVVGQDESEWIMAPLSFLFDTDEDDNELYQISEFGVELVNDDRMRKIGVLIQVLAEKICAFYVANRDKNPNAKKARGAAI